MYCKMLTLGSHCWLTLKTTTCLFMVKVRPGAYENKNSTIFLKAGINQGLITEVRRV